MAMPFYSHYFNSAKKVANHFWRLALSLPQGLRFVQELIHLFWRRQKISLRDNTHFCIKENILCICHQ
jgi:hypothetical protein